MNFQNVKETVREIVNDPKKLRRAGLALLAGVMVATGLAACATPTPSKASESSPAPTSTPYVEPKSTITPQMDTGGRGGGEISEVDLRILNKNVVSLVELRNDKQQVWASKSLVCEYGNYLPQVKMLSGGVSAPHIGKLDRENKAFYLKSEGVLKEGEHLIIAGLDAAGEVCGNKGRQTLAEIFDSWTKSYYHLVPGWNSSKPNADLLEAYRLIPVPVYVPENERTKADWAKSPKTDWLMYVDLKPANGSSLDQLLKNTKQANLIITPADNHKVQVNLLITR